MVLSRRRVLETSYRGHLRATDLLSELILVSNSDRSDDPSAARRVAWLAFWRDKLESLTDLNSETIDRDCLKCLFDEDVFGTDILCLRAFAI